MMANSFRHCAIALIQLVAASTVAVGGAGVASATDPLVGQTYSEASAQISKIWKAEVVLATVVGDSVSLDDCIVSSWRKEMSTKKVYLSLYCNDRLASSTSAGHSAASPEGRAAKQHAADVKWLQDHPELCVQYKAKHPELFEPKPIEGCEGAV